MKINLQNYEAFYLDLLEGNLSHADELLLEQFLDKHPELRLEDTTLLDAVIAQETFPNLTDLKSILKAPDYLASINETNVETFLIGALERQLPAEKQRELAVFLQQNPSFISLKFMMDQLILSPDLSITYAKKSALKKRVFIPMYWKYGATAAVATLVLFAINWKTSTETTPATLTASKTPITKSITKERPLEKSAPKIDPVITPQPVVSADNLTPNSPQQKVQQTNRFSPSSIAKVAHEDAALLADINQESASKLSEEKVSNAKMAVLKTTELKTSMNKDLIALEESINEDDKKGIDEYIFYPLAMKNPVQPLTNKLSEIIKGEVEFKTSKAANEKPGGFFLKIGNFAISKTVYIRKILTKK